MLPSSLCGRAYIDIGSRFLNLQPGDLIFFVQGNSERKERVVHGYVYWRQAFHPFAGRCAYQQFRPGGWLFDEYNLGRLLFATRVLPYK